MDNFAATQANPVLAWLKLRPVLRKSITSLDAADANQPQRGQPSPFTRRKQMKTRNQNRGYEIAARLMDNYEGKQDMDSNTWNDLVVRVGDAINQAKVGAGIRRIAEAEGVIETEETE